MPDPITTAYADCIDMRCPSCHAEPGTYCTNPITGQPRRTPCWSRIHESEAL